MVDQPRWKKPFWSGPYKGGVSFSKLSDWLECRERFRLSAIEGLEEKEPFNHRMEYGSIWHSGEEAVAEGKAWKSAMKAKGTELIATYPEAEAEINKWVDIAIHQFKAYLAYWQSHPSTRRRKYYMNEQRFRVAYRLPSGRTIFLKGFIDAAFTEAGNPYIQENKTKGTIYEEGITGGLPTNLQTALYLIAHNKHPRFPTAKGVLYNVIRRPLSEKHPIRPRKNESHPQFMKRMVEVIESKPDYYFMRWKAVITPRDLMNVKRWCIDPILEQFTDWWEWITTGEPWRLATKEECERLGAKPNLPGGGIHWRMPFGCYNSLANGWEGSFFNLLCHGSRRNIVDNYETLAAKGT